MRKMAKVNCWIRIENQLHDGSLIKRVDLVAGVHRTKKSDKIAHNWPPLITKDGHQRHWPQLSECEKEGKTDMIGLVWGWRMKRHHLGVRLTKYLLFSSQIRSHSLRSYSLYHSQTLLHPLTLWLSVKVVNIVPKLFQFGQGNEIFWYQLIIFCF